MTGQGSDPLGVGFGRFGRMPDNAPVHACTRCFRPDVSDGFVIFGDHEWQTAAMIALAGVPEDQAIAMVAERKEPPEERYTGFVRLCKDCGRITDAPVESEASLDAGIRTGRPIPACVQPGSPGLAEFPDVEVEG